MDGRLHQMRCLETRASGNFMPELHAEDKYKFESGRSWRISLKADPYAFEAEKPPRPPPSSTRANTD